MEDRLKKSYQLNSLADNKIVDFAKLKAVAEDIFIVTQMMKLSSMSQLWPTRMMFVYKIQVNPIHTIFRYGDYYDFLDR